MGTFTSSKIPIANHFANFLFDIICYLLGKCNCLRLIRKKLNGRNSKSTIYLWFTTSKTISPRISMARRTLRTVTVFIILCHRPTVFSCRLYGRIFRNLIAIVATKKVSMNYTKHCLPPYCGKKTVSATFPSSVG